MSSPIHLLGHALVASVTVLSLATAGCGSDSEPSFDVGETTPATTDSTTPVLDDTGGQRTTTEHKRLSDAKPKARRERKQNGRTAPSSPGPPLRTSERPRADQPDPPARSPRPRTTPPAEQGPPVHSVTENASLTLVSRRGVTFFVQEGAVQGTLSGQMRLQAKLAGEGIESDFTVTLGDGTLAGSASARLTPEKSTSRLNGTASINKGTGAYSDLVPAELRFSGRVAADGAWSKIRLSGELRY